MKKMILIAMMQMVVGTSVFADYLVSPCQPIQASPNDRELVLAAVKESGLLLACATPSFQKDKEIALAAIINTGAGDMKQVYRSIKGDLNKCIRVRFKSGIDLSVDQDLYKEMLSCQKR